MFKMGSVYLKSRKLSMKNEKFYIFLKMNSYDKLL